MAPARRRFRFEPLEDRLAPAYGLDPTFGAQGVTVLGPDLLSTFGSQAVQSDGKILITGRVGEAITAAGYVPGTAVLARYNSDGSPDTAFGQSGVVSLTTPGRNTPFLTATAPDGRISVAFTRDIPLPGEGAGHDTDVFVYRLNADGTADLSFGGGDGVVNFDFIASGDYSADPIAQSVSGLSVGPDGSLAVIGSPFFQFSGGAEVGVARLTADGSLDTAFGDGGVFVHTFDTEGVWAFFAEFGRADDVAVAPDGSVYFSFSKVVRTIESATPMPTILFETLVLKLTPGGALDTTFNGTGVWGAERDAGVGLSDYNNLGLPGTQLAVLPGGKVLVAVPVAVSEPAGDQTLAVTRLNADGSTDTGFGAGGRVDVAPTISDGILTVLPDGRLRLTGTHWVPNSVYTLAVAVGLTADGQPDPSFGTEGVVTWSIAEYPMYVRSITPPLPTPDGRMVLVGYNWGFPMFLTMLADLPPAAPPEPEGGVGNVQLASPPPLAEPLPGTTPTPAAAEPSGPAGTDPAPAVALVADGGWLVVTGGPLSGTRVAPFGDDFPGPLDVASGDIDGDGVTDYAVAAGAGGGPRVLVFLGKDLAVGVAGPAVSFWGIVDPGFRGGVRVAVGDLDGDGRAEIIVAAGAGGGPRVTVWGGAAVAAGSPAALADFFAFEAGLRDGAAVAAGDLTGDGRADLIFGAGPGGAPRVRVADAAGLLAAGPFGDLDAVPGAGLADFYAGDPTLTTGVRVGFREADGVAAVVTAAGDGADVRVYPAAALAAHPHDPAPLDPALAGVFVG